jgi:transcriptional regulator with XRE-family HTH domain
MRDEPLARLKQWRERRSLSQRELAGMAELSEAAIIRLEKGQRKARPQTARRLATALRVDVDELYGDG